MGVNLETFTVCGRRVSTNAEETPNRKNPAGETWGFRVHIYDTNTAPTGLCSTLTYAFYRHIAPTGLKSTFT